MVVGETITEYPLNSGIGRTHTNHCPMKAYAGTSMISDLTKLNETRGKVRISICGKDHGKEHDCLFDLIKSAGAVPGSVSLQHSTRLQ